MNLFRRKRWQLSDGVDARTKLADLAAFIPYIEQSTIQELKQAAEGEIRDTWGLTIGEFISCLEGHFDAVGIDRSRPDEMTALQYYWVEAFRDTAEAVMRSLEALKPPRSKEAEQASQACKPLSFREGVIIFLVDYYRLHSSSEALELHLSDLLIAKKDSYNQAAFEMARAAILERKNKTKK